MTIAIERDPDAAHVAHCWLDFGQLNLLSPDAIAELGERVRSVSSEVSVLTIEGTPDEEGKIGGLTGGLKLDVVSEFSATEARDLIDSLHDAIEAVRSVEAVTVCGCGEYALGAGLELAMACDFRVATEGATLGLPEIDVGLVTGIHGGLLVRLVSLGRAKELIYLGEPVSGTHAAEIGLVNRAVPAAEYDATVEEVTTRLAAKSPPILRRQKEVFRAWRSMGVERGIDSSRTDIAACFDTDDQLEAMRAFLEKRDPEFADR